ncbi:uncharacterized protein LOC122246606 [Penaeus japonicus]|uniref:uncharacterized protein LOC122246606 n=1 Tax=Penaeus japonicus TaxID=27405 RepID=UPI001C70DAED|nr:uncharacterized protein LOC122246606 [Penaeus japonicus]XP_042861201.1 uncharacterized protein LOC122246606 [Penaeus japonicus]XP_042861202.1 uncharacterized protein LOC122246606 [Penaeus japonicus]
MTVSFFVTHGRGLDVFAQEEIKEKVSNVCNVQTLGEGKISFSVPLKVSEPKMCSSEASEGDEEEELLVGAVSSVYNLKLVERIFILLHCEKFSLGESSNGSDKVTDKTSERMKEQGDSDNSKSQLLKKYENKLADMIDKEKWAKVASQVKVLRKFQDEHTTRVLCQDPSNCPGSVKRRAEKQELWQRKPSEETSHPRKKMRVEGVHHTSETKPTESDIACKSDPVAGTLKEIGPGTKGMNIDIPKVDDSSVNHTTSSASDASQNEMATQDMTDKEVFDKGGAKTVDTAMANDKLSVSELQVKKENCTNPSEGGDGILSSDAGNLDSDTYRDTKDAIHDNSVNFRVSGRISGQCKNVITQQILANIFIKAVEEKMEDWTVEWRKPLLDFYINITNSHFIVGVSLSRESLSLRPYIPHITLRSTVSYLMARLAQIPQGGVALDPMCGGGTILREMAKSFKVGLIIGGDINQQQLEVSRCNLQNLEVPFNLVCMDAVAMPLMSCSVSAVVCDVPFGQKHQISYKNESALLRGLLCECQRVLTGKGRLVLLVSSRQHGILKKILPVQTPHQSHARNKDKEKLQLKLHATYQVSLGETSAHIAVLQMLPSQLETKCHMKLWSNNAP